MHPVKYFTLYASNTCIPFQCYFCTKSNQKQSL